MINKGALFHDQELLKVWHILGTLYELGLGTDRDLILAYAWYNITAAEGFNGSKKDLARVERIISPDELREAQVLSREWKPGRLLIRGSNQPSSSGVVDGKSPASNASGKTLKLARVGTGFFISSNGNVLTSNHVVDGCVEIRFPADNSIGKAVLADTANDIAFVKTDVVGKPILYFPSGDDLKQGAEIFAFGYPLDGYLPNAGNITTGIVSALAGPGNNSSYIQITAPVQPNPRDLAFCHGAVL